MNINCNYFNEDCTEECDDCRYRDRYYLTRPGHVEEEVTKQEWIYAERAAGFRPKLPSDDPRYYKVTATGGFGGGYGTSGRIRFYRE